MARKDDDAYNSWLEEEFLPSVSEDQRDFLKTALVSNEKAKSGFLRQSDYTRKTKELSEVRKEAERVLDRARKVDAYDQWYETHAKPTVLGYQTEIQRLKSALTELGGEPGDAGTPHNGADSKRVDEIERRLALVDSGALNTITAMTTLAMRAAKDGFDFDAEELLERASRNRVSPIAAYDEMTKPLREERERKALEERLKKAEDEGYRKALSKFSSPDVSRNDESVPTLDALFGTKAPGTGNAVQTESARVAEALQVFHDAGDKRA